MGEPMSKVVFVVAHDGGCEGHGVPLKAFATEALAKMWTEAANTHSGGFKYYPMDLISPDDLAAIPSPQQQEMK